jgi:lambda family phage minor tail protein L
MLLTLFKLNTEIPTGNNILDAGYVTETLSISVTTDVSETIVGVEVFGLIVPPIELTDSGTISEGIGIAVRDFSLIGRVGNKLDPGIYLELFDFDATYIGGTVSYYSNTPTGGLAPILWRGNSYYQMPLELTGVDYRADGTAPNRPQISVSNINKFFRAAIGNLGDLTGLRITRWRTFAQFIDDGEQPNVNMHYPIDTWTITRLIGRSKFGVQYELSGPLDRPGLKLPRKQILRDSGFPGVSRVRAR